MTTERLTERDTAFLKRKLDENISDAVLTLFLTVLFAVGSYFIFYHVPMEFWITKRRIFTRPNSSDVAVDAMGELPVILITSFFCLIILFVAYKKFKIIELVKDLKFKGKIVYILEVDKIIRLTNKEIKGSRELGRNTTHIIYFKDNLLKLEQHSFNKIMNPQFLIATKLKFERAKYSQIDIRITSI